MNMKKIADSPILFVPFTSIIPPSFFLCLDGDVSKQVILLMAILVNWREWSGQIKNGLTVGS